MEKVTCQKCGSERYTSSPEFVKCGCEQNDIALLIQSDLARYLERLNLLIPARLCEGEKL